jgi:glycerol-3-phosphate O-acyltransferase
MGTTLREATEPAQPRARVLAGAQIARDVERRVVDQVLAQAQRPAGARLDEVLQETLSSELSRLAHADGDLREAADREFIQALRRRFVRAGPEEWPPMVLEVVRRYLDEISGRFEPAVYAATTRLLPPALAAFLHGVVPKAGHARRFFDMDDRVLISGELTALRSLMKRGTVVLAPTHVSNLDSVILGLAVYRLGLPPVAYGAGLNLFTSRLIGYFMRHLGAFTIDRKKSDPLYRATLKAYATLLLERGQHVLFFPGGTRSRSGTVESKLKLGLLGTAPLAFRHALESNPRHARLFVVPCTLTYPLVLEAATLAADALKAEGGAHYVDVRDEFEQVGRWVAFLESLLELDLQVHVRVGRAMDPFGNEVDERGDSLDPRGRVVDPARYLWVRGEPAADDARDAEYTRTLGERLAVTWKRETVALPTSLLAFTLFERVRRESREPDLFRMLRGLSSDVGVKEAELHEELAHALEALRGLAAQGRIQLSPQLSTTDVPKLVRHALETFATYHHTPVIERRGQWLHVGDPSLLFYYRNRLDGFGLPGAPPRPAPGSRA